MKHQTITSYICLLLLAFALLRPAEAKAFDTSIYTERSVLADGKWVKVGVETTGMHFIPASDLRSWGFSDPKRVRVYGYGGTRINDLLSRANYVDDLPMVQTVNTDRGVYFYGVGPVSWQYDSSRRLVHKTNPYTFRGYYFITENDEPLRDLGSVDTPSAPDAAPSVFTCPLLYEKELMNYGESGNTFFGESFIGKASQSFLFTLTDRVEETPVMTRTVMATDGLAASTVEITANGAALAGSKDIPARNASNTHIWYVSGTFDREVSISGTQLNLGIKLNRPTAVVKANLDYIEVNYTRSMALNGGLLDFNTYGAEAVTLGGVDASTRIWEVTDPLNIAAVNATIDGDRAGWRPVMASARRFAAWNESAKMPSPTYIGAVTNQNLHSAATPDMVVFASAQWGAEAERLANLHRSQPDALNVLVVDQQEVFNEFGSGAPDFGAFRRMLKMLYDRGNRPEAERKLRYVLFFGATSFDNRLVTSEMKSLKVDFMPSWQTDVSNEDGPSFTSDDVAAMLTDNSTPSTLTTNLDIAVGRIPCRSVAQAKGYVDKLADYMTSSRPGLWHNTVLAVADNGNSGVHMTQTEDMLGAMERTDLGARKTFNKVYLDAYDIINGTCVGARNRMYRQLNDGTLLWTFVGHGALESLTAENMVRTTDIDNEMYFRNLPMLYAATCNFMQWDGLTQSGAERLFFNTKGGIIAAVSATRTAVITPNGELSKAFGANIFAKDEQGRLLTVGEALRRAKNDIGALRNNNRMRFSLMGSPAMRLATPENEVKVETIAGETVHPDADIIIKARQNVKITGVVTDPAGNKLEDFNGSLWISLYDAAESVTSKGTDVDSPGAQVTFDDRSSMLYQGRDTVIAGEYSITIAMPSEIADNYRPALLSLYARSRDTVFAEASGSCSDFYVYGIDTEAEPDDTPPVIEYAYLNHQSFTNGSVVNESPMLIASVTDDVGINLSMAGIGHQMSLQLDGKTFYTDVSLYYTPFSDGTPGGTIAYPLSSLPEGNHELTFRVYDTSGNPANTSLSFFVQQGAKPDIFDIFSDANPASTQANFYLQHNRPDAVITVTFEVYDIMGRRVWSSTSTDRSDMFLSAPITWDLCNQGGARVTRGIYIYRAMVKGSDGEIVSRAKRLAVTGR